MSTAANFRADVPSYELLSTLLKPRVVRDSRFSRYMPGFYIQRWLLLPSVWVAPGGNVGLSRLEPGDRS